MITREDKIKKYSISEPRYVAQLLENGRSEHVSPESIPGYLKCAAAQARVYGLPILSIIFNSTTITKEQRIKDLYEYVDLRAEDNEL